MSILYKFQIDISSNSREIKYQNIGRTRTQTRTRTPSRTPTRTRTPTPTPTPTRCAALSHERVALSHERAALSHERAALSHERAALSHERAALSHERELDITEAMNNNSIVNNGMKNRRHFILFYFILSPVRSTYGGYYGLVVVTPPRPRPPHPRPRPHFIVYAIT